MRRCDIEFWCEVDGYPDYECSTLGRIRRKASARSSRAHAHAELRGWLDPDGYRRYELRKDNKKHLVRGHVAVAATYYGPCPDGHECRHLDGDPSNNRLDNLAWGTDAENKADRAWHKRHPRTRRPAHVSGASFCTGAAEAKAMPRYEAKRVNGRKVWMRV